MISEWAWLSTLGRYDIASLEWISHITSWTGTSRSVIYGFANCVQSTCKSMISVYARVAANAICEAWFLVVAIGMSFAHTLRNLRWRGRYYWIRPEFIGCNRPNPHFNDRQSFFHICLFPYLSRYGRGLMGIPCGFPLQSFKGSPYELSGHAHVGSCLTVLQTALRPHSRPCSVFVHGSRHT